MTVEGCADCGAAPDLFPRLRTRRGMSASRWLWAPAAREVGHVVVARGTVTVHVPVDGCATVVRARPDALPIADRCVPALVVGPLLPDLRGLGGLFAELRRVLRPHGLLTMAVPDGPSLGLRGRALRGRVRAAWSHRSAVDHPDWLLTAADFAVLGDDRLEFRTAVDDPAAHVGELIAAGLLPSGLSDDVRAELTAHRVTGEGRVVLRRVVARR